VEEYVSGFQRIIQRLQRGDVKTMVFCKSVQGTLVEMIYMMGVEELFGRKVNSNFSHYFGNGIY
jgi:hypothetical protein